jgi:hypothetical protein
MRQFRHDTSWSRRWQLHFMRSSAVAKFKMMDPNSLQFLEVQRGFDERLACYKEIYKEKEKAMVQSSLDKFIRKAEMPVPSTFLQSSTSFATSAHLLVNVG